MASRYPKRLQVQNDTLLSSCGSCNEPDNGMMVQCDECDSWHHFECVNLSSITEEESWFCPSCVQNQLSIVNTIMPKGNRDNNSTIDSSNQNRELQRNNADETFQGNLAIAIETRQPSNQVIFEEVMLNRLRNNPEDQRPTFNQTVFDRHTMANLTAPGVSQGVFMAQRQIFGICSRPRLAHSTPGQRYNRHVVPQQSTNQQRECHIPGLNENQQTNYYSSNEYQPNCNESDSVRSSIHNQPQARSDRQSHRASIYNQTTVCSDRKFEPNNFTPSSTNTTPNSRRIQIELQRLEEEKQAHQTYIDRKYRILLQDRDSQPSTDRQGYTNEWVNNINQDRHNDFDQASIISNEIPTEHKSEVFPKAENMSTERRSASLQQSGKIENKIGMQPNIQTEFKCADDYATESSHELAMNREPDKKRKEQVLDKRQIAARQVVTRDLPAFDGNPEDWPLFYSRFQNSTNLCGYSNAENMDRLQKCLKGKARIAAKHLLLLPESVPQVISTLQMLFGRPEFIVNHMINKVSQLAPPKMDKLDTVVDFAMEVQNVSAIIELADLQQHLSNPQLITGLVNKLPVHIRLDWARFKASQQIVNLSTLAKWLYKLAEVVATVTEPVFTTADDKKKSSDIPNKQSEYFNAHQEDMKAGQQQPKYQNKGCIICQKNCPNVAECTEFNAYPISQRWKLVSSKQLCRTCLRLHFGFCRLNKSCGVNNCNVKHHSLLHDEERVAKKSENTLGPTSTEINSFHHQIKINNKVLLRIIPVKLFGDGCSIDTFAFIDDGSTTSLIDQRIVDKLNIKGIRKELCLLWSGTIHRTEKNSQEINVGISSISRNSTIYHLKGVKTVEQLGIPAQRLIKDQIYRKYSYLRGVPFDEYEVGLPGILIGSNNPKIGIPIEIIEGDELQPIASRTRIGWTIHGPTCQSDFPTQSSNSHTVEECSCDHDNDNDLHQYVKDYFSVENFGVQINNFFNKDSKDNERAMEEMKRLTKKTDDGNECGLLWRYDQFELPDSYGMAIRRLQCLENRRPEVINTINNTIIDYIKKGYVTKLTEEEIHQKGRRVWYLPIFTVTSSKKPDKIRTVFDAAAKVNGISLNSMLLKGPDQLVSLIDILRRFRERSIAAVGDIREMYHQIKTRVEDKNCQRFLWRNGENRKPDVYVMNVMTFGATCSPSIAHYVKNYNASKFEKQFPQAVETITKNHYVDDMMESVHTEEEMIQLINEVKMIHAEGGFQIRNFLSNSKAVMETFSGDNGSEGKIKRIVPEKDVSIERVLGMWWNTDSDCFTFSLKFSPVNEEILLGKKIPTKREMLKLLMSIFDPLGLISHFLNHLKIIIQEIWRLPIQWDQRISEPKIIDLWQRWLELLPKVEEIQIPRLYTSKLSPNTSMSIELHTFVDAGDDAFGAVCYLRVEDKDGVDCSLVGSKVRVAPLKYLSVPRKELQAAILGARLSSSILSSQNIVVNRRIFWSDSKTVLSWLNSDHRRYHQFVAHRVGEILENTDQNDWRWIPSKKNVADETTKWSKPPSFENSSRWFSGPEFLKLSRENWPKSPGEIEDTKEEMKMNFAHSEITVVRLIDPKRFSNWNRMLRALAYVIRYVRKLKCKIRKASIPEGHLSQEELVMARNIIIRQAQFDEYPEEVVTLTLNKNLQNDQKHAIAKSSSIYLCSPYLDGNGIIRISGRIDLVENVPYVTKRPVILPRHHHVTKLLMKLYHRIYHHRNNETVVNELRQKYYIPKLRIVLKSVIKHECQACMNRKSVPQPPEMARLPFGRLAVGFRPFTYCSVDFFGPMEIVNGRRAEKRWGSLFTCLTTRAIHIEIAHSLSTESFIKCLRNFISLRGRPSEMFSDDGTNFVGAANALAKTTAEIDFTKVATEFTTSYSKWNFNPPHAPHFNGACERLVRSVKTSLYAIMPERRPNDESFRNLLMEVQNVINSRPLTFIPLDHENDEALTPNHFLLGSSNGNKPPCVFESNGPNLRSAWRETQRLTDLFWKRFVKEYLPTLVRRTKWIEQAQPLEIGDIAIDIDPAYPRNSYPKVKVIDRTMDATGQVRRVRVQFANGSMLWRPASAIARLDIIPKNNVTDTTSTVGIPDVSSKTGTVVADSTPIQLEVPLMDSFTAAESSSKTEGSVEKPIRSSARIANRKIKEPTRKSSNGVIRR